MKVTHQASIAPFYTEEKCFIQEFFNHTEHPNISIAKAIVKPAITTQKHALSETEEWYYILKGKGIIQVNGETVKVKVGTCIYIPANATQSITNNEDDDLEFLCICNPRFQESSYVSKELD